MSYALYDLTESFARVGLSREQIASCYAAWGEHGDCAEWTGGFILDLTDGRRVYLSGWCDTTGWGFRDGAKLLELPIGHTEKNIHREYYENSPWDLAPSDINRWIQTGEGDIYA